MIPPGGFFFSYFLFLFSCFKAFEWRFWVSWISRFNVIGINACEHMDSNEYKCKTLLFLVGVYGIVG